MTRRWLGVFLALLPVALAGGCGISTGARMGMNVIRKDSHILVSLDGHEARQNVLTKTVVGHSSFKVVEPVSTTPTLRFEIDPPDKLGRITMVVANIYQKFESDYSHQADFKVFSASQDPQGQMKPNTDYNLASPAGQTVHDLTNRPVAGVSLKPGMEYMLQLTIVADRSETISVYFKTK